MARYHQLVISTLARENLRDIAAITRTMQGFGDLSNQMRRAAISVVSNISEGAATCRDAQFIRYLTTARASANERQAQLAILADLGGIARAHPVHDRSDRIGRSITSLIRHLGG